MDDKAAKVAAKESGFAGKERIVLVSGCRVFFGVEAVGWLSGERLDGLRDILLGLLFIVKQTMQGTDLCCRRLSMQKRRKSYGNGRNFAVFSALWEVRSRYFLGFFGFVGFTFRFDVQGLAGAVSKTARQSGGLLFSPANAL